MGMRNMLARQSFRTHRSFTTHVFDKNQLEVLRVSFSRDVYLSARGHGVSKPLDREWLIAQQFHRPFAWISSRIQAYDPLDPQVPSQSSSKNLQSTVSEQLSLDVSQQTPRVSPLSLSDMRVIGEAQQQWAPLRRKYNLFITDSLSDAHKTTESTQNDVAFSQFAHVDEPFLSWDFSLLSADTRLIGSVNRNFAGFAREILTDTGIYALRMDAAGLAEEPRHLISKTGERTQSAYDNASTGMTLDQRAVMLATAVSVDFDYFSKKSHSGGMGFLPLWFPGAGEAAAEGEAAAGGTAAAEAEAGGIAERAAGEDVGGAVGAGAATAGIGAMRGGGAHGDASPSQDAPPSEMPSGSDSPLDQGEEVWGEWNPWERGQGSGGSPPGGEGGGGYGDIGSGGGGEGGEDWEDWF